MSSIEQCSCLAEFSIIAILELTTTSRAYHSLLHSWLPVPCHITYYIQPTTDSSGLTGKVLGWRWLSCQRIALHLGPDDNLMGYCLPACFVLVFVNDWRPLNGSKTQSQSHTPSTRSPNTHANFFTRGFADFL